MSFDNPKVMGIINITPDSFYENSRTNSPKDALTKIEQQIKEGADIIDIGAMSSRPGAGIISHKEEMERLTPVLKELRSNFPNQVFSLDTIHSESAYIAVEKYGIDIINDISGGDYDKEMFKIIAQLNVPYVLMHSSDNPDTMQEKTQYENIAIDINKYLAGKINTLRKQKVKDIIIDPGFGFGKTLDQNYELLNNSDVFQFHDCPILMGVSRKSMIYKNLDLLPNDILPASSALNLYCLMQGANILRVHDVAATKQVVDTYLKILETK